MINTKKLKGMIIEKGTTAGKLAESIGINQSTFSSKISVSQINIRPIYNEQIEGEIFFECIVKANAGNIITESIKHFKNKH